MTLKLTNQRVPLDEALVREIYIDESSQTKHRFLLLGAIAIPLVHSQAATAALAAARLPELPAGELKWTKISRQKANSYKRVVDVFFEDPSCHGAHFHCLVIDTRMLKDKKFNGGDREIGFNKEIYQLATKCARLYDGFFHVYPDERESKQDPEDLRLILNRGRRKNGDVRSWPFRRCQFRDSKKVALLQLTDLMLGSVGFKLNGHYDTPDASPAKCDLSDYILRKAKVTNVTTDTAKAGKFTIWHRQLLR